MGYKCDVCQEKDGAVFCFADHAVMCQSCDLSTHSANKQARKHERVALKKETESTPCDICQEHKATMFCSEDRALICRRCDLMIHTANEFTAVHHRYLLSGVAVGLKPLSAYGEAGSLDSESPTSTGVRSGLQHQKRAAAPSWRMGDASASRDTWRRGGSSSAEEATHVGMASNPSAGRLVDSGAAQMGHSPSLGALTGASLLDPTPFAAHNGQDGGQKRGNGSNPALDQLEGMWRAGSTGSGFTLAAELLGVPSVSQAFTAKDIDAAYMYGGGDDADLDADLSSLLEVPDLDFGSPAFLEGSGQTGAGNMFEIPPLEEDLFKTRMLPDHSADGVVPDLGGANFKRQRLL